MTVELMSRLIKHSIYKSLLNLFHDYCYEIVFVYSILDKM